MSNDLAHLDPKFGALAPEFVNNDDAFDDLGEGILGGYAVMGFRGKVWRLKFSKEERPLVNTNGDPLPSIEAVIVASSHVIAKNYYPGGFKEGSVDPPICWSTNGITPDPAVEEKQNPTCLACKWHEMGSRITEDGRKARACADNKRLAIVPAADITNETFGGPMLLRVPAASLVPLKDYGMKLKQIKYVPAGVVTRLSFLLDKAYPQLVFNAVRALTSEEARKVLNLRQDPRTARILAEGTEETQERTSTLTPEQVFEQPPKPAAPAAPAMTPAAPAAPPQQPPTAAPLGPIPSLGAAMAAFGAAPVAPATPAAPAGPQVVAMTAKDVVVERPTIQQAAAIPPIQDGRGAIFGGGATDPGPIPGFLQRTPDPAAAPASQGNGAGTVPAGGDPAPGEAVAAMEDALNESLNALFPKG